MCIVHCLHPPAKGSLGTSHFITDSVGDLVSRARIGFHRRWAGIREQPPGSSVRF